MKQNPLAPGRATTTGRVALEGMIVHIPDVLADREYVFPKGQQLRVATAAISVSLCCETVFQSALFVLLATDCQADSPTSRLSSSRPSPDPKR